MGKAAKIKAMRKVARQLPVLNKTIAVGQRVLGKELIYEGIEEVEGKAVVGDKNYRRMIPMEVELNHERKMKELYNKFGLQAVINYANAVINYARRIEQQKLQTNKQDS